MTQPRKTLASLADTPPTTILFLAAFAALFSVVLTTHLAEAMNTDASGSLIVFACCHHSLRLISVAMRS